MTIQTGESQNQHFGVCFIRKIDLESPPVAMLLNKHGGEVTNQVRCQESGMAATLASTHL